MRLTKCIGLVLLPTLAASHSSLAIAADEGTGTVPDRALSIRKENLAVKKVLPLNETELRSKSQDSGQVVPLDYPAKAIPVEPSTKAAVKR